VLTLLLIILILLVASGTVISGESLLWALVVLLAVALVFNLTGSLVP
jgi:hypothetical protein